VHLAKPIPLKVAGRKAVTDMATSTASDRPSPRAPTRGRGYGHSVGTDRVTTSKARGQTPFRVAGRSGNAPTMATARGRPAPHVTQGALVGRHGQLQGQAIVSEK
jgi:hypothetical protein